MSRIAVLPPDLASQIAAGEVVERPASVVKELVENALDAGATRIDVAIEGGGITLLQVSDDGHGMSAEDAAACLGRHATSKLTRFDDLEELASFGFRGEALPSVASVSRLEIVTRAAEHEEGSRLTAEGTTEGSLVPIGAPVGTTVTVRDLFFNVPARRKFLRSSNTESGHVGEIIVAAALGHPSVTFTLKREGRLVKNLTRVESRAERVAQVLQTEGLLDVGGQRGPLLVECHLSRPEHSRRGAAGLRLVINGRPIKDRALAGTVAHAYGSILERGRFPLGVVYIDLPTRLVDVNVHPQKAEVRFADPRAVSDALYGLISRSLGQALAAPTTDEEPGPRQATAPRGGPWQSPSPGTGPQILRDGPRPVSGQRFFAPDQTEPVVMRPPASGHDGARTTRQAGPGAIAAVSLGSAVGPAPPADPAHGSTLGASHGSGNEDERPLAVPGRNEAATWRNLRFLNQVRKTYLICESDQGLYVLDQHAAAERVAFSKLRSAHRQRRMPTQAILFPVALDVTPSEEELLEERREEIANMGLDVRVRGSGQATVHGVPRLLHRASPERLVRDLLRELSRTSERAYSDAIDKVLATMACHAAVRAGDSLSSEEAQALLSALDGADFAGYCPHGRPIVAFTSWAELERKVGRR